eukprot:GGOE01049181.1.p1 GENE.GGOE01049181.1~~GGOE01049181.1.p1  ORF type:complete len:247 (+),score=59.07 GGOE01049181.1:46-786(+)
MPQASITNYSQGTTKKETVPERKMPDNKRKGSTVSEKETKKARTGKKKKDPNAPKRPLTAFFIFLSEKRETYLKENPTLKSKNTEVVKALSEVWKKVDHKPFEEKAAADKKRYEAEMKNYTPPEGFDDDEPETKGKRGKKKEKDPNAPKRALSAYMLFSTSEGPKIRETVKADPKSAMAKIAEAWKNVDQATKQKFEKLAVEDKKRYDKEVALYKGKGKSTKPAEEEEEEDAEESGEEEADEGSEV